MYRVNSYSTLIHFSKYVQLLFHGNFFSDNFYKIIDNVYLRDLPEGLDEPFGKFKI